VADLYVFISETINELALLLDRYLKKIRAHHSPHDIHDARIASRRLRASLEFAACQGVSTQTLTRRLKKLNKPLSALRTQDSLLSLLNELSLPDTQAAQKFLRRQLKKQRSSETDKALECLKQKKLRSLPKAAKRVTRTLQGLPKNLDAGRSITSDLIRNKLRGLTEYISLLSQNPSTKELHRARILIKRLRYSWEVACDLFGIKSQEIKEKLLGGQKVGGQFHDLALLYEDALALHKEKPDHDEVIELGRQLAVLSSEKRDKFLSIVKSFQEKEFGERLLALLNNK
jgi:CHAD domain-containing protein